MKENSKIKNAKVNRQNVRSFFIFSFVLLTLQFTALAQSSGGPFAIPQSVVANGGGASSGGGIDITGTVGQTIAGANSTSVSPTYGISGGFWQPTFAPTAAMVSVSGRVRTSNGRGIRNVWMTITNGIGTPRTALTSTFGYFRFDNIEAGQSYIVSAQSKRYQFPNPSQVIFVNDEFSGLEFTALP